MSSAIRQFFRDEDGATATEYGLIAALVSVAAITALTIVDGYGAATDIDATRYRLEQDTFSPRLRPVAACLPGIPQGGSAEIRFAAGYGSEFASVPADLQQAVFLLAAHYYEYRDETALGRGCMPFGVTSLLDRFRPMRLGFGGV